jgi:DNA polymerase-3 subunit chi
MTGRIDFYVLGSAASGERRRLACRLAEQAYLANLRVIIWSATEAEARTLDELLWTFEERAFVPHRISRDALELEDRGTPVHVTVALDAVEDADLLVNLADRLPEGLPRFARVAEIMDADEERRRLGRERFKAYREQKLALKTHQCEDGRPESCE